MTTNASSVRTEILAQHGRLRAQLSQLRAEARQVVHQEPGEIADLPGMLGRLLRSLDEHIAFEESQLTPLLQGRNPFGHRYAQLLLEDHARQREDLAIIARQADDPDDVISLAMVIQAFTSDVLRDMDDEELPFLTPQVLSDVNASPDGGPPRSPR
jgi:hypothetical protein